MPANSRLNKRVTAQGLGTQLIEQTLPFPHLRRGWREPTSSGGARESQSAAQVRRHPALLKKSLQVCGRLCGPSAPPGGGGVSLTALWQRDAIKHVRLHSRGITSQGWARSWVSEELS